MERFWIFFFSLFTSINTDSGGGLLSKLRFFGYIVKHTQHMIIINNVLIKCTYRVGTIL